MAARIDLHRRERPQHWRVREEPIQLGNALRAASHDDNLVLIDCLTLWTANCLWPPTSPTDAEPLGKKYGTWPAITSFSARPPPR